MRTGISKDFQENSSECPEKGHSQRIFFVFREVFRAVLDEYRDDGDFVFIEDDAKILNFRKFHSRVCSARRNALQFYSFYRTSLQVGEEGI